MSATKKQHNPARYLEVFDDLVDANLALSLNSHLSSPQGGWVLLAHGNEGDSHLHWKADFDYESSIGMHTIIKDPATSYFPPMFSSMLAIWKMYFPR